MDEVFHSSGHGFVHHFQTSWNDPSSDHSSHCIASLSQIVKTGHDASGQLRLGRKLHSHLRGDGQHPFGADDQRQKIQASAIQCICAKLYRLTFHGKAFYFNDVVQCEPILQAMHAARVFCHIAANRAGNLAAWIGRVIQTQRGDRFTDGQIPHATLHDCRTTEFVNLQNFVEFCER